MPEKTPAEQSAELAEPESSLKRRMTGISAICRPFWPILNLFIFGILVGQLFLPAPRRSATPSSATPRSPTLQATQQSEQPRHDESLPAPSVSANVLQLGDALFMEGNPSAALKKYQSLALFGQGHLSDGVRYRIAVCSEAIGNLDRALAEYRELVSRNVEPRIEIASRIGQARVWFLSDQLTSAKVLLCRSILDRSSDPDAESEIHSDFVHLLAHVLGREAIHEGKTDLLADSTIMYPRASWSANRVLKWIINGESEGPQPDSQTEFGVTILNQFGPRPEEIQLKASLPQMPIVAIVELLAQRIGFTIDWSDEAKQLLLGRSGRIVTGDLNLAVLLDALLCPLDLSWKTLEGRIQIGTVEAADANELRDIRMDIAERALRNAISTFPEHDLSPAAYVLLGNIAFTRGEFDVASSLYQQLLRQFPRARVKSEANFNQAKTFLLTQKPDRAREAFYRVVDIGRGHKVEPLAYLFVGRLLLEKGEAKKAISPLIRAVSLSKGNSRTVSIVTLAGAYLMSNNPNTANRLMMEYRVDLRESQHHDQAAFLSALARYRADQVPSRIESNGRMLIAALSNIEPSGFFGAHNHLLVAHAYREVELHEQMVTAYENGLRQLEIGTLRNRMIHELADHQCEIGNFEAAKFLLADVATGNNDSWGWNGRFKVAEISYLEGQDGDCLKNCRELLDATVVKAEQTDILKLMGKVYQRQGNYYDAALCFSGMIPGTNPTDGNEGEL